MQTEAIVKLDISGAMELFDIRTLTENKVEYTDLGDLLRVISQGEFSKHNFRDAFDAIHKARVKFSKPWGFPTFGLGVEPDGKPPTQIMIPKEHTPIAILAMMQDLRNVSNIDLNARTMLYRMGFEGGQAHTAMHAVGDLMKGEETDASLRTLLMLGVSVPDKGEEDSDEFKDQLVETEESGGVQRHESDS